MKYEIKIQSVDRNQWYYEVLQRFPYYCRTTGYANSLKEVFERLDWIPNILTNDEDFKTYAKQES